MAHEGISQYFPIRHFCLWLSIDWRTQIALLKENSRFDHALQGIRYEAVAGWCRAVWIRRDLLGR